MSIIADTAIDELSFDASAWDPYLPVAWRFLDAGRVAAGQEPEWARDDPAVANCAEYLTALTAAAADERKLSAVEDRWPEIAAAHELAERGGPGLWELQARLLAGEGNEEIAGRCRLFEALTGYMPPEFERFMQFNAETGELEPITDGPGELPRPVVMANPSGTHAMGIYAPPQTLHNTTGPTYETTNYRPGTLKSFVAPENENLERLRRPRLYFGFNWLASRITAPAGNSPSMGATRSRLSPMISLALMRMPSTPLPWTTSRGNRGPPKQLLATSMSWMLGNPAWWRVSRNVSSPRATLSRTSRLPMR